ncbi:MAG: histidinol-phosphate transaminase [Terriglobia bacterium]|jgi:histidinol-phosphate aminotransferase|nr:histidinol-phosphate transaminase [Terriglobia bacterium]
MLTARNVVQNLKEYHPPLGGRTGLRLDFNENSSGCSPRVLESLSRINGDVLSRYPEREPVEAIAAEFLGLNRDQVLLTNGVDEAIHLVCETYLEPGDESLIVVPTFSMYEIYARATGADVFAICAAKDFEFPTAAALTSISGKTRLIAIANPNNPTGKVVSRERLIDVIEEAPNAAVLIDEAYFEFYGQTLMDLIGKYDNLFIARTFSKAYGLAGFRVGVLAGSATQMKLVRRVSSPYNVNGVALACLPEALADREYVAGYSAEVRAGRRRLENELEQLGIQYWPSQANFVLARFGKFRKPFIEAMRAQGILVRDRNSDPGCEGCVRITVGTNDQTNRLLRELRGAVDAIGWKPSSAEASR